MVFNMVTPAAVTVKRKDRSSHNHKEQVMFKLTLRYVRYALSTLATVGFGTDFQ